MEQDTQCMKRCLDLARQSYAGGDLPFGSIIVDENFNIVSEAMNTGLRDITGHAEINAIKQLIEKTGNKDFFQYTIYTNFEPCAMCSFIIRDIGIGRVVYGAKSPFLGGDSRWDILTDTKIRPEFTSRLNAKPPNVTRGVLENEANKMFDDLNWEMHKDDLCKKDHGI